MREVEEATGKAVSNAFAGVYVVPYDALMAKAGYRMPSENGSVFLPLPPRMTLEYRP